MGEDPERVGIWPGGQRGHRRAGSCVGLKRIIVFDADTGSYKRMWGAFGNVPTDDPAPAPGQVGPRGEAGAAGQRGGGRQDVTRIPAKELDPKDPGPPQFSIVHGVKSRSSCSRDSRPRR